MKRMKKLLAIVLSVTVALTMGMAVTATAFAANHTVSVSSDNTAHTYEIYQVFTGDVNNDGQLINLKYGANTSKTAGASVSATDMATLATIEGKVYTNDQEKITDLLPFVTLSDPIATIGKGHEASVSLAEGYYLIKDTDNSLNDPDTYTLYLFEVLGDDLTITPKDGTTTVDKTVTETNDSTGATTAGQKGADYDEGDSIPYSIDITLAKNVTDYKTYTVTLTDTLSEGLTPPAAGDVTVTLKDKNGTAITGFGAPEVSVNGQVITVTYTVSGENGAAIGNAGAALNEAVINVSYNAVLNNKAKVGVEGNPNTYSITYSNNPNNNDKGTTPEKEVNVYTYELEIVKVDGNNQPLQGAEFTLYKEVTADYSGAKTGSEIKATLANGVDASKLDDAKYYVPITMTETATADAVTHKADKKIDAGNYVLIETKVPEGYNAYAGEKITITSTIDADGNLTALTATPLTVGSNLDVVSGTVENQSGAELPSTGGIGTTIFYILGALLVIGCGIVLVARRRMAAK